MKILLLAVIESDDLRSEVYYNMATKKMIEVASELEISDFLDFLGQADVVEINKEYCKVFGKEDADEDVDTYMMDVVSDLQEREQNNKTRVG